MQVDAVAQCLEMVLDEPTHFTTPVGPQLRIKSNHKCMERDVLGIKVTPFYLRILKYI